MRDGSAVRGLRRCAGLEAGESWVVAVFMFRHKTAGTGAERLKRGKNALWITDFVGLCRSYPQNDCSIFGGSPHVM